jgi:hypothetical protein
MHAKTITTIKLNDIYIKKVGLFLGRELDLIRPWLANTLQ